MLCPKCRRIKSSGKWVELDKQAVLALCLRKVKSRFPFELQNVEFGVLKNFLDAKAKIVFTAEGVPVTQEITLSFPLKKALCEDCSKKTSGYKEAIVQIRGEEKKVAKTLKTLERLIEGKTFWKVEEKKTGVDLTAGSKSAVLSAIYSMKVKYELSHKLMGVKDGKKVFLTTALLRV